MRLNKNICKTTYFLIFTLQLFILSSTEASTPSYVTVQNDYVKMDLSSAAAVDLHTTGGNPGNSLDNNIDMLYGWMEYFDGDYTTFATVILDGVAYKYGSIDGTLTTMPTATTDSSITSTWRINNVDITQVISLVTSNMTGREDNVEFKYIISNQDSVSHQVGIRVRLDTKMGDNFFDPIWVPGVGRIEAESEFTSSNMPDYWMAFDNLTNPTFIMQGTVSGGEATAPSRLVFADWSVIGTTNLWDFTLDPTREFFDTVVAVYWEPEGIQGGSSEQYITYYGLSDMLLDKNPPLVIGLTAPSELSIIDKELSPSPFTIVAFLENSATGVNETLTGITAELTLPFGLELDSGETAEKTVSDLAVGENTQVSWEVVGTGIIGDSLSYSVTVSVGNSSITPSSKVVSKYVTLPRSVPGFVGTRGDNQVSFNWTNLDLSTLTWNDIAETNWQGTLILRREGAWPETLPTDGTSYNTGDTVGSATVIYVGSGNYSSTPLVDTGLTNGTRYYYTGFTYDSEWDYIPAGAPDFVTPLAPDTSAPANITEFSAAAGSGSVRLSWVNPSINDYPDFEGVRILRRTGGYPTGPDDSQATYIYNGTGTGWTDTFDITNETTYYYTAYTYDEMPNYSNGSQASAMPSSGLAETGGGGGGGGGCFVATAAYGTPFAKEVKALTQFRDRRLMNCEPGKQLVKFYYDYGPAFARYVEAQPVLKAIVRGILKPCVYFLE